MRAAGKVAPKKGGVEAEFLVEWTVHHVSAWGYRDIVFHGDSEPAMLSLVKQVQKARSGRTVPEHGAAYSHQSQGLVEESVKAVDRAVH